MNQVEHLAYIMARRIESGDESPKTLAEDMRRIAELLGGYIPEYDEDKAGLMNDQWSFIYRKLEPFLKGNLT